MKSDTTKFTLRTDPVLLKKFHSVADYNGRSANREKERTQDILEESLRNNEVYQTAMEEHDKACERLEMAGLNEEQNVVLF